ncbi:hypothetical protein KJ359_009428 [Pestalotiopsis sp. 9143b]|nr:hypothetical protein KJ359_009428 [Pestalotiopsis sp. 9143b]
MGSPALYEITPEKEASKAQFLRRQFSKAPPALLRQDADLSGKTAILTGANGGIGIECSRQLLDLGLSKLILAVRDEAKGESARKSLTHLLKPGQSIEIWQLDYASYDSVVAFAQRAEGLNPRLDIAILNSGVNRANFNLNPATGHEEDLQTNYLSTVLLTLLLLRAFKKAPTSSPGRIVIVSSDQAAWAKFDEKDKVPLLPAFDDKDAKWYPVERYATTKLLGQLFVSELAKRTPSSLAVINCANPGLCYGSQLGSELGVIAAIFIRLVGHPTTTGARSLVYAAAKPDEKLHGQYIEDATIRPMAPFVYSKEAEPISQRLWEETLQELSFAGVKDVVDGLAPLGTQAQP